MAIDIRAEDQRAFQGVIEAREALIQKQIERFIEKDQTASRLAEEAANSALDAFIELRNAGADPTKAIHHLELSAAMAITAINALMGEAK
jgi:hypothetical protein